MKNKSVSFRIRMPRHLKEAVAKQAQKEGVDANQIACKALEEFLKNNGDKKYEHGKRKSHADSSRI